MLRLISGLYRLSETTHGGTEGTGKLRMLDDHPIHLPFRVLVDPHVSAPEQSTGDSSAAWSDTPDNWSLEDIEAAYQQALESLDSLDATVAGALGDSEAAAEAVIDETNPPSFDSGILPHKSTLAFFPDSPLVASAPTVSARQVLEALLFVGGTTLPSRQLAEVLGGSTSSEDVLQLIDELNSLYDAERRPYRIELVEGGYRMQLRSEFEKVRHRVYGFGPREVKLSQEVLELLAFIAYSQPVSEENLDRLGRTGTPAVIRQLLRRELIQLNRGDPAEVRYETAPRFLEVFGLRSMHDLPLPSDLAFK